MFYNLFFKNYFQKNLLFKSKELPLEKKNKEENLGVPIVPNCLLEGWVIFYLGGIALKMDFF